jgi:hypothetical protein
MFLEEEKTMLRFYVLQIGEKCEILTQITAF